MRLSLVTQQEPQIWPRDAATRRPCRSRPERRLRLGGIVAERRRAQSWHGLNLDRIALLRAGAPAKAAQQAGRPSTRGERRCGNTGSRSTQHAARVARRKGVRAYPLICSMTRSICFLPPLPLVGPGWRGCIVIHRVTTSCCALVQGGGTTAERPIHKQWHAAHCMLEACQRHARGMSARIARIGSSPAQASLVRIIIFN
jgi:hypothetical protein